MVVHPSHNWDKPDPPDPMMGDSVGSQNKHTLILESRLLCTGAMPNVDRDLARLCACLWRREILILFGAHLLSLLLLHENNVETRSDRAYVSCSDRRRHRIRWHSFVKSHRPSLNSQNLQISNMSAGQLMVLRKLSLLKVTALIEKYSPTNRSGWNW